MRSRVSAVALTGALALTALTVPVAQADVLAAKPGAAQLPTISDVVVNGGKAIVLGTTEKKTVTVTFKAKHPEGIYMALPLLWHGSNFEEPDGLILEDNLEASCTSGTTSTCTGKFIIDPRADLYYNKLAGNAWKVSATVIANDGESLEKTNAKTFSVQRASKLTVNAAPEPVAQNATITVTGALTRANWETYKYSGYADQSVNLQFRKATSNTYTTVKTIKTDSKGNLKTTVKASSDGFYRYAFAGTATTPAVNAAGDQIDVR
ncbi:calcium-binding protein [Streptomyces sp. NPDC000594]|uniref:calcium-binding protein n=1 Tax=Streptomyces sp. NPDC000594 TaxID=3154261 RepID=UPI003332AE65